MVSLTNLIASAAALLSIASAAPTPMKRDDCISDVKFTNDWPEVFCEGQQYGFHWEGGSGNYNLLATLTYDGQFSAHPAYFLFNSTLHDYGFLVPQSDPAKPNTKYAFMIASVEGGNSDLSPHIPVKNCLEQTSA